MDKLQKYILDRFEESMEFTKRKNDYLLDKLDDMNKYYADIKKNLMKVSYKHISQKKV